MSSKRNYKGRKWPKFNTSQQEELNTFINSKNVVPWRTEKEDLSQGLKENSAK